MFVCVYGSEDSDKYHSFRCCPPFFFETGSHLAWNSPRPTGQ